MIFQAEILSKGWIDGLRMSSSGSDCTTVCVCKILSSLSHPLWLLCPALERAVEILTSVYVRRWADWLRRPEESWDRCSENEVAACFQRAQTLNPQSHSSRAHEAAVREAVKGISLQPPHPKRGSGSLSQTNVVCREATSQRDWLLAWLSILLIKSSHRWCWEN